MMTLINKETFFAAMAFVVLMLLGVAGVRKFIRFDIYKVGSTSSGGERKGTQVITVRELSVEMNVKWYLLVKFGVEEYKEFWNASTVIPVERLADLRERFEAWSAKGESKMHPDEGL